MIITITGIDQLKRILKKSNTPKIIYIHVDWCRHCTNIAPAINTLMNEQKYKAIDMLSIAVSNENNEMKRFIIDKMNVTSYPTFIKYDNSDKHFYEMVIEKKNLENIKKMLDNFVTE